MKFTDRYDSIIEIVENNISEENETIEEVLSRSFGENIRLIADAFKFISGKTLSRYLRERKLINALKARHEFGLSFEEVAEQYGFSDASAFSKSAKTCFGKAPTQMTKKEIDCYLPLTINRILDGSIAEDAAEESRTTSFGVSEAQFNEISKTLSIAAVYGLSDDNAELAYSLSKSANIPVDSACDFVADWMLQIENRSAICGFSLVELATICYLYDQSYSEAQHIMYELERAGILSINDLPDLYFSIYFSDENSRLGLDVMTIYEMAETMDRCGLDITYLFDIVDRGQWKYEGDYIEAIENFVEDEEEYKRDMEKIMFMSDREMMEQDKYYE